MIVDVSSPHAGHAGVVVACAGPDAVVVRIDAEMQPAPIVFRLAALALDRMRAVDVSEGIRGHGGGSSGPAPVAPPSIARDLRRSAERFGPASSETVAAATANPTYGADPAAAVLTPEATVSRALDLGDPA
ncbi:MAG: hypothetical protein KIT84_37620 [Labilithrix sp.]|nr:hypothetical protein [Labilithrix sp.]MCW5816777.1 hypothetical protein [Labilithrix sp.]